MRFVVFILAAVLACIGLTACGGTTKTVTHTVTVTAQPKVSTPTKSTAPMSTNDVYCETIFAHTDWPNTETVCKSLIHFGHTVCSAFSRGVTFSQLVAATVSNYSSSTLGWDKKTYVTNYGYVIGAATAAYCPQFKSSVKS